MDVDVRIILGVAAVFVFILSFMDEGDRRHL